MKKTAFLFLALLLAGCAEGPSAPTGDPGSPETAGAPVVLLDNGMDNVVAVDLVRVGKNANGFLTVQANIRNRTGKDQEFQVQTLFYDDDGNILGNEAGNPAAWTALPLTASATEPYRAQAVSKKAYRASVRVRYLHRPA